MAEIALAAAAIQFLDVGARTLLILSQIASKVKDAPDIVHTLLRDVQIIQQIAQEIQADPTIARLNALAMTGVLREALSLEVLLGKLAIDSTDGFRRKSSKALRSVKYTRKLETLSRRLETAKITLIVDFERRSATRLANIDQQTQVSIELARQSDSKTAETSDLVGQSRSVIDRIDARTIDASRKLEHDVGPAMLEIKLRSQEIHTNVQQSLSLDHRIDHKVDVIEDVLQGQLAPSINDLHQRMLIDVCRPLASLKTSIDQISARWLDSASEQELRLQEGIQKPLIQRQLASRPAELKLACDTVFPRSSKPWLLSHHLDGLRSPRFRSPTIRNQRLCTCLPSSWFTPLLEWRSLSINYQGQREHLKDCHLYPFSHTRRKVALQVLLLTKWLWQLVEWSLAVDFGAGGLSISPSLTACRLVDRQRSPAFRMMDEVIEDLCEIGRLSHRHGDVDANLALKYGCKMLALKMREMQRHQMECYTDKTASPYDIDIQGSNLLHLAFHMLTEIVECALWSIRYPHQALDEVTEALIDLISFLTAFTINNTGRDYAHRTPFGSFLKWLNYFFYYRPFQPWKMSYLEKVVQQLCKRADLSLQDSFAGLNRVSPWTMKVISRHIPNFTDHIEQTPLAVAVTNEDETELTRLLATGTDPEQPTGYGYNPADIARYWTPGFRLLLKAKSSPALIFNMKGYGLSSEIIAVILDAGEPLYPSETLFCCGASNGQTVLTILEQYLLSEAVDLAFWRRLIGALVQRRQALTALARRCLPQEILMSLRVQRSNEDDAILDRYAVAVADAIELRGYTVPAALWPYGRHSVYDLQYPASDAIKKEHFDVLYEMGFWDTNIPNTVGFTPIQESCLRNNVEIICWFLEHGADFTSSPTGLHCNCFHLLAERLCRKSHQDTPYSFWARLISTFGFFAPDKCRCACSKSGCTVIGIMFRGDTSLWLAKLGCLTHWVQTFQLSQAEIETCCEEFIRMETFERLGITHVCCRLTDAARGFPQMQVEDQLEIMEEEVSMIRELEELMDLYLSARSSFSGSPLAFVERWSAHLKKEGLERSEPFADYRTQHDGDLDYYCKSEPMDMIDIFGEGRFTIADF